MAHVPMKHLHGHEAHRGIHVERTCRVVVEVVLLGRERHPSRVGTLTNAAVHAGPEVANPRLADHAARVEIVEGLADQDTEIPSVS